MTFEEWAKTLPTLSLAKDADGDYIRSTTDMAHLAWMVRDAQAKAEQLELKAKIDKYEAALHEINTCRSSTTNYGVPRAIACKALGIKHTDSKQPPSTERVSVCK